jgi:hypothetical protein
MLSRNDNKIMQFNVPQFIDIEDKIVGPFTAKQLGWMGLAGVLLLIFWSILDFSAFIIVAIIIVAVFGALAFYRPYNQPLIKFIISSVGFMFRPKIYVWRRYYDNMNTHRFSRGTEKTKIFQKKTLDNKKLSEITKRLDRTK